MRVVVSTIGRFHSFDLARQMQRHGALKAIFTGYPRFKVRNTGVDPALIHTFPWLQTPYMLLTRSGRFFRRYLDRPWVRAAHTAHDAHVAARLPDCDLVSGLSGLGLLTGRAAKRRGIVYVCDRGSTHIRFQDRVLRQEFDRLGLPWPGVDPFFIEREMAEYELADAITIPSDFVRESFIAEGVPAEKLILAPYGVCLEAYRRSVPRDAEFRVLFVGQLTVRKGLHVLLDAFRRAALPKAKLVLVGSTWPETEALLARFPVAALERPGHLPRVGVVEQMSRASVLVLPSLEEGLALVQAQALSCGCPVIATPNTGAANLFEDGRQGFVVPVGDADAVADRLRRLYEDRACLDALSQAALTRVAEIGGWTAYGDRLHAAFTTMVANRR